MVVTCDCIKKKKKPGKGYYSVDTWHLQEKEVMKYYSGDNWTMFWCLEWGVIGRMIKIGGYADLYLRILLSATNSMHNVLYNRLQNTPTRKMAQVYYTNTTSIRTKLLEQTHIPRIKGSMKKLNILTTVLITIIIWFDKKNIKSIVINIYFVYHYLPIL